MTKVRESVPKVGIILLNYCNYKDTITCVNSLLNMKYQEFHIYIIDNHSPNDSMIELKKLESEKITVQDSGKNGGFAFGNNCGIDIALRDECDYVLLLNNDTTVDENILNELVSTAAKNKDAGIITAKILYGSDKNKIWYAGGCIDWKNIRAIHIGINEQDYGQYDEVKKVSFASGCCMLIPALIIQEVGKLPEEYFMYYEDLDYCMQILNSNRLILYVPKAVVYHYVSSSSGGSRSPFVIEWCNRSRRLFAKNNNLRFVKSEIRELFYILIKDHSIKALKAYKKSIERKTQ